MTKNKPLARAIRRLARAKLRTSPALWKDYKRARPSLLSRIPFKRAFTFLYPLLLFAVFVERDPLSAPFIVLVLYCTATVFGRAGGLNTILYRSGDLAFFMHVPVTDRKFFDLEFKAFLRSSSVIWIGSFVAFALGIYATEFRWMSVLAAVAAATLQWCVVLSLSLVVLRYFPAAAQSKFPSILYVAAFAAVFLPRSSAQALQRVLTPLPTAWVPDIFLRGIVSHEAINLYALVFVIALIAFLPMTARSLRESYPLVELQYPLATLTAAARQQAEDGVGDEEIDELEPFARQDFKAEIKLSAPPANAITLPILDWQQAPWIERLASRWFSPRERTVASFLCAWHLGSWSRSWLLALKITAVSIAASFFPSVIPYWIPAIAIVIGNACALPVFGGSWRGLAISQTLGLVTPAYAGLPLGYSESSRVLFKVGLLRYLLWLPFFLISGAALARSQSFPILSGIEVAFEIFIAMLAAQPAFIILQHSNGTNDSKRATTQAFVFLLINGVLGILYVLSVIFFFVTASWTTEPTFLLTIASLIGMFLFPWLIWLVYKQFYNRGRMDLMRLAQE